MAIFGTTLNQMAFLFSFILLGYILSKLNLIPDNAQATLSKLENYLFIPALVLGTFIDNFTVSALFPEVFLEYIIFTLPLWTLIYLWGVPALLMGDHSEKQTLSQRLKSFLNPMFICMLIGMVIGLLNIKLPAFVSSAVSTAGSCMSPIAMLLTGMTLAKNKLGQIIRIKSVYLISVIRLIVYPALFLGVGFLAKKTGFVSFGDTFYICALCSLAMPLGLNTIVIPSAYGKDTTVASGMALVSHLLGCITIPLIFALYQLM